MAIYEQNYQTQLRQSKYPMPASKPKPEPRMEAARYLFIASATYQVSKLTERELEKQLQDTSLTEPQKFAIKKKLALARANRLREQRRAQEQALLFNVQPEPGPDDIPTEAAIPARTDVGNFDAQRAPRKQWSTYK